MEASNIKIVRSRDLRRRFKKKSIYMFVNVILFSLKRKVSSTFLFQSISFKTDGLSRFHILYVMKECYCYAY